MRPLKLWHYTAELRINEIIESGVIKLATKYLEKRERPAVWLSSNPVWENTATKMVNDGFNLRQLSLEEMKIHFGLARIEVIPKDSYITWGKYKYDSGISARFYGMLESEGLRKQANPKEWYASFEPILKHEWLSIEIWKNNKWEVV